MAPTGESVYTISGVNKRRKTDAEREADAAKRATLQAVDPSEPWALATRQPWADKEVAPAVLNEEQKAYLEQVGRTCLAWQAAV